MDSSGSSSALEVAFTGIIILDTYHPFFPGNLSVIFGCLSPDDRQVGGAGMINMTSSGAAWLQPLMSSEGRVRAGVMILEGQLTRDCDEGEGGGDGGGGDGGEGGSGGGDNGNGSGVVSHHNGKQWNLVFTILMAYNILGTYSATHRLKFFESE